MVCTKKKCMFAALFWKVIMKIMKLPFFVCVLLLALMTVSCSHSCECTLYEYGTAVATSTEVAQGQSCSEFSSVTETPYGKMGLECVKKKWFFLLGV